MWAECSEAIQSSEPTAFSSNLWGTQTEDIRQIYSVLQTHKSPIFCNQKPTVTRYIVENHHYPYVPTKLQWSNKLITLKRKSRNIKQVVFQIDTPSDHHHDRYFSHEEKLAFKKLIVKTLGKIDFIAIGRPKTIPEIVKITSESELFFGTCSGMSHICHSVGIPMYLKNYSNLENCHRGKEYTKFNNFHEVIPIIESLA